MDLVHKYIFLVISTVAFLGLQTLFSDVCAQDQRFNPEFQIVEPQLRIICPKCGFVFYICDIGEIFEKDTMGFVSAHCKPADSRVPLMQEGADPFCPFDHARPYWNHKINGVMWSQAFTNKGWLPQRDRPRWQE